MWPMVTHTHTQKQTHTRCYTHMQTHTQTHTHTHTQKHSKIEKAQRDRVVQMGDSPGEDKTPTGLQVTGGGAYCEHMLLSLH